MFTTNNYFYTAAKQSDFAPSTADSTGQNRRHRLAFLRWAAAVAHCDTISTR